MSRGLTMFPSLFNRVFAHFFVIGFALAWPSVINATELQPQWNNVRDCFLMTPQSVQVSIRSGVVASYYANEGVRINDWQGECVPQKSSPPSAQRAHGTGVLNMTKGSQSTGSAEYVYYYGLPLAPPYNFDDATKCVDILDTNEARTMKDGLLIPISSLHAEVQFVLPSAPSGHIHSIGFFILLEAGRMKSLNAPAFDCKVGEISGKAHKVIVLYDNHLIDMANEQFLADLLATWDAEFEANFEPREGSFKFNWGHRSVPSYTFIFHAAESAVHLESATMSHIATLSLNGTRIVMHPAKDRYAEQSARMKSQDFMSKFGIADWANLAAINANPFRFEGQNVGIHSMFGQMISRDRAIFRNIGPMLPFVIEGMPVDWPYNSSTPMVIAAEVVGNTQTNSGNLPLVELKGYELCSEQDCRDFR